MKHKSNSLFRHSGGFTLLEVIISITVSAVLAVILVQFFRTQSAQSWVPIRNLNQGLALQSAMDQITSDYRSLLINESQPLKELHSKIENGSTHYWDANTNDIEILSNHCIEFTSDTEDEWTEVEVDEVDLRKPCIHSTPTADTDDTLLKVTLSYGGQTLTTLFSR